MRLKVTMGSMARLGIVGFPNVGKTTLFNAVTGLAAATGAHPFTTSEPRLGVAKVADPQLQRAAQLEGSATVTEATLELLDLPPLVRGQPQGRFLAQLREVDALIVVLRAFTDPAVPAEGSGTDPIEQAEELLLELAVADHEVFARKAERSAKEATADATRSRAALAFSEAAAHLGRGELLRSRAWSDVEQEAFRDLAPLTSKPAIWVINVDESEASGGLMVDKLQEVIAPEDVVLALSARLEEEGSLLSEEARGEIFAGLGLGEGALARMVAAAYQSLDLISFYTLGPKEARAWTVKADSLITTAAGKIHSDLERGFIRAEVATIAEVIAAGGWEAAKHQGLIRIEGRDYRVKSGDVLLVRFSV
jgi:GTP-binding protein YchF